MLNNSLLNINIIISVLDVILFYTNFKSLKYCIKISDMFLVLVFSFIPIINIICLYVIISCMVEDNRDLKQ